MRPAPGPSSTSAPSRYLEDEPQLPHVARTEAMSATIDVSMNRDAFDDNAFVDDGSTYEVDRSTHDERQNGNCMPIFDTRSLRTYAFTDRPNGPAFENYSGGYIDRTSGIVVLSVVIHYPYLVTADECNDSPLPNFGIGDTLLCSGSGLEGKLTEISAAPDEVDFECTADIDAMDYDTQTVTVSGVLELR